MLCGDRFLSMYRCVCVRASVCATTLFVVNADKYWELERLKVEWRKFVLCAIYDVYSNVLWIIHTFTLNLLRSTSSFCFWQDCHPISVVFSIIMSSRTFLTEPPYRIYYVNSNSPHCVMNKLNGNQIWPQWFGIRSNFHAFADFCQNSSEFLFSSCAGPHIWLPFRPHVTPDCENDGLLFTLINWQYDGAQFALKIFQFISHRAEANKKNIVNVQTNMSFGPSICKQTDTAKTHDFHSILIESIWSSRLIFGQTKNFFTDFTRQTTYTYEMGAKKRYWQNQLESNVLQKIPSSFIIHWLGKTL